MPIQLTAIRNLFSNVKKLDSDKLLKKVLSNTSLEQDIIDLNREDQLYERGVTVDGLSLGEYSPATIHGTSNFKGKIEKGQRYDHITLNDTGATYESEKFVNNNDGFLLTINTNLHGIDLEEKFGKIVGLDEKNKSVVREWIKDPLLSLVRSEIKK